MVNPLTVPWPMWKAVYASVQGTMHLDDGMPCQDACRVIEIGLRNHSYLVSVCSDGAGSASHSHEGSKIACETFSELAETAIASRRSEKWIARDWTVAICNQIHQRLSQKADEIGCPLREMACTLLASIIGDEASAFLQIGDGAMVASIKGKLRVVFWPQSGEYTNTTNFLTDPDFEASLCHSFIYSPVNEFAAFTDGLERLALKFEDQSVYSPFFIPMLKAMREEPDVDKFFKPLLTFLDSPKVNDRTNDDKTLILATRVESPQNAEAVL